MLIDLTGFEVLTVEEQREYVLESIRKVVIEEAKNLKIRIDEKMSTQNIIRNLSTQTNLRTFSKSIVLTLLVAIGTMQKSEVKIIESDDRMRHGAALFCYNNENILKSITVYDNRSNIEFAINLINELEIKRILPDKETMHRLQLKF